MNSILPRFAPTLLVSALAACSNEGTKHAAFKGSDAAPDAASAAGHDAASNGVSDAASDAPFEAAAEPTDGSVIRPILSTHPDASEAGADTPYPRLLSQTGLFADIGGDVLGDGVRPFQPKYVLWSDGATKRRWMYLPPGERIDTSDMDYWVYPVGTKIWKEFTVDGVRVETRMQYKSGPNKSDWVMIAYQWRDDLSDAEAVPDGVPDAKGTLHDIPSVSDCQFCHGNMKDSLLGVTAIQLSHSLSGVTITDLIAEGRLSNPPAGPFTIPGDSTAEAALGYLHANCGTCHNPESAVYYTTPLRLWESTSALDSVETTTAYLTAVGQHNNALPQYHIIEPGYPDLSEMILRMSARGIGYPSQMPPVATEIVDTAGVAKVRAWIESLPPLADGGDAAGSDAGSRDSGPEGGATDGG